jgi:hypothetical protein
MLGFTGAAATVGKAWMGAVTAFTRRCFEWVRLDFNLSKY